MTRRSGVRSTPAAPPPRSRAFVAWALVGLAATSASTWVHYKLLRNPGYESVCDVSSTVSCTEAYMSRYGSVAGIPVALIGMLYFVFLLGLVALCSKSARARPNLAGYVFALSTAGLAVVLYLAYASAFILGALCLLCLATYAAVVALFVTSAASTRFPMTTLPRRAGDDLATLVRTPAALSAAVAFVAVAAAAVVLFPGEQVAAQSSTFALPPPQASPPPLSPAAPSPQAPQASQTAPPAQPIAPESAIKELEQWLSTQVRVPLAVGTDGAAVVIVKFNDYQCPPCGQSYANYKPVFAKYAHDKPGKVKLVTKDFPLEPECNTFVPNGLHPAACESAVAVRLAREKGRAEAMEEWLFANQPSLSPERVREAAGSVGGVTNLADRYAATLELVRGDVAQGGQLGVRGTPTFFMNGIRLPGWPAEILDAAIAWELRRLEK